MSYNALRLTNDNISFVRHDQNYGKIVFYQKVVDVMCELQFAIIIYVFKGRY